MPITNDFNTKITPATVVGKQRAYVTIPVFSYIDLDWTGASNLVCIFNYQATNNFTISSIDVPNPIQASQARLFIACIKWVDDDGNVFRYKILDNVNGLLYVDMYNGEFIGKNFSIEIWSADQPLDSFNNPSAITINMSILKAKTALIDSDTYVNVEGVQCTDIFAIDDGIDMLVPLQFSVCAAGNTNPIQ